jgi:hypothetical protein
VNDQVTPVQAPDFVRFIAAHGGGYTVQVLTDKLKELVEHLETLATNEGMSKSKATLSVKFVFEREQGIYKVGVEPSLKLPTVAPPKSVFWATPAHGLVQQDPRQTTMNFRDAGGGGNVRVVDSFDRSRT